MDPTLLKYLIVLVRLAILAVALIAGYLAFYYVVPYIIKVLVQVPVVFLPFIIAIILAMLIEPLVKKILKKFSISRGLAVLLALTVVWGSAAFVIGIIVSRLVRELIQLYRILSTTSAGLSQNILLFVERMQNLYLRLQIPSTVRETLQDNVGSFIEALRSLVQASMNIILNFMGSLPEVITIFIIATIATFFISRDKDKIIGAFNNWVGPDWADKGRRISRELGGALVGFVRAQAVLVSISAVLMIIGLLILGAEYALTIGLVGGLLDILPIIGPGLLFIPWSLWMISTGHPTFGCGLLVLYGIIAIVRQILEPKIVADNIGLHPLATLISLYVGLKTGGVLGMIMGPVILVIFVAFWRVGIISLGSNRRV